MFEHLQPKFGQEFEDGELKRILKEGIPPPLVRFPKLDKAKQRRRARGYQLKRKYDMTLEEYDRMIELQCGCCAVCGGRPDKPLVVDHDHDTGAIRGLLCGYCNRMLGMACDEPATLRAAAEYIEAAWERNPLECE